MIAKRELRAYSSVVRTPLDLVGDWENELGSLMSIERVERGLISGRYASSVSQKLDSTAGRLTGFVAADVIGIVVDWAPRFKAVTCWSGKLLAGPGGEPCIHCVWQLSGPMRDPSAWWESFLTGCDTFWRAEATEDRRQ